MKSRSQCQKLCPPKFNCLGQCTPGKPGPLIVIDKCGKVARKTCVPKKPCTLRRAKPCCGQGNTCTPCFKDTKCCSV